MKKGEIERKEMMKKLEERIREKLEEPTQRVDVFEARNWIQFINQNVMSLVRFYSGPVKFTLVWLDRMDKMIRQHLTLQGMLMKRGMTTSSLYMKPDDMGMGLKSCVAVYLLESSESSSSTNGGPSSDRNGSGGWKSRRREMARGCGFEKSKSA